ncbi:hypothetical protein TCON_0348 [Astathelohania contejeani]|uniref:Uncharacterized protein n=1 Tax=Astathelohania contejeani TaxID=164912 RepID=A0ABQ7I262_9MICR|nr:hypothetical protein TCON_0348 [Thelohania contejeani]
MINIQNLIKTKNHHMISQLEGDSYKPYRVVALIHLGRYDEALAESDPRTFERAYIYFKKRNYRKCLKELRRVKGKEDAVRVLRSQAYYHLRTYGKAYALLKQSPIDDEIAVNLMAIASMKELTKGFPHQYSIQKVRGDIKISHELDGYKFKTPEAEIEYKYNELFQLLKNKPIYIKRLEELGRSIPSPNIFINQLKNMFCKEIDGDLSKGEEEVAKFNRGEISKINHPRHFQLQQALGAKQPAEYEIYKDAQDKNYKGITSIPGQSDNLKILQAFIYFKENKNLSYVKRVLDNVKPNRVTEIMKCVLEGKNNYECLFDIN